MVGSDTNKIQLSHWLYAQPKSAILMGVQDVRWPGKGATFPA